MKSMFFTLAFTEFLGEGDEEGVFLIGAFDGRDGFTIGSGYLVVSVCGVKEEFGADDHRGLEVGFRTGERLKG